MLTVKKFGRAVVLVLCGQNNRIKTFTNTHLLSYHFKITGRVGGGGERDLPDRGQYQPIVQHLKDAIQSF